MEEVIEIVNQLQDVFSVTGRSGQGQGQGLELPQVLVVGAQSSGKSSVLEHLVGKSFLPRGSGVVTRCPLVLQMVHRPADKELQEYAIFNHDEATVFTEYDLIRREIEEQTERLAGANRGICDTPIVLKMYSPSVLNLTLLDLPGITKVPVGDQPPDIEEQTRDLILSYAKNPNSIILAVSPANADMATSESIKLAREVDPNGERTLAVITKLDLMDEGTDAHEMLNGKIIPVKLGIIGVVNRSQKDIMEGKSVAQSLKDEVDFLNTKYKAIAARHGTQTLKKSVQSILISHIHNCLPKLKEKVKQKLMIAQSELDLLGDGKVDKQTLLLDLTTKFSNSFCSAINGNSCDIETTELFGGARINYVFQESLAQALNSIEALQGISKTAVLTAIKNASGARPALFVPEVAFELLTKQQIRRLRGPSLQCVDIILEELLRIVQCCAADPDLGLHKFPNLQQRLYDIITDLLKSRVQITNESINHFIDVQLAYINTAHPDFLPNSLLYKVCSPLDKEKEQTFTRRRNTFPKLQLSDENFQSLQHSGDPNALKEKGSRDCVLLQELIQSYYSIVQKSVQDVVPKLIMHFLVNHVMEQQQTELVARLYRGDVDELLRESQVTVERRGCLREQVTALTRAADILDTFKPNLQTSFAAKRIKLESKNIENYNHYFAHS